MIAFVIYFAFFGWLGHRRGTSRELTVFLVASTTWVLLRQFGDLVRAPRRHIWQGAWFVSTKAGARVHAHRRWVAANESTYLLLIWLFVVA